MSVGAWPWLFGFQSPMLLPLALALGLFVEPYGFWGRVSFGAICFCAPLASGVHWLLVPFDIGASGL